MNAELMRQHQAKKERAARFAQAAFKHANPVVQPKHVRACECAVSPVEEKSTVDAVDELIVPVIEPIAPEVVDFLNSRSTIKRVQQVVARHFDLTLADMKSPRRQRFLVVPRQVGMYITREKYKRSLPEIGYHFGGRDHTTVLHGCRRVAATMAVNESFAAIVEKLSAEVAA